jgi:hypothetical protein
MQEKYPQPAKSPTNKRIRSNLFANAVKTPIPTLLVRAKRIQRKRKSIKLAARRERAIKENN